MNKHFQNDSSYESKTVSKAALRKEIGSNIADKIIAKYEKDNTFKIPNVELLRVGDIILTRDYKPGLTNRFITAHQQAQDDVNDEASTWYHAMVYIGNMQVVESTKKKYFKNFKYRNGPRMVNLTDTHQKSEKIICRCKQLESFPDSRHSIGRYAMIDLMTNNRKYSSKRIGEMLADGKSRKEKSSLNEEIICSEYALELLALGGRCMVEEYEGINVKDDKFFYPANFHASDHFEKLEFGYLTLET